MAHILLTSGSSDEFFKQLGLIKDPHSALQRRVHPEESSQTGRRRKWDLALRTIRFRSSSSTSSSLSEPRPSPTGSDRRTHTPRKEKEASEESRKGRTFETFPFDRNLSDRLNHSSPGFGFRNVRLTSGGLFFLGIISLASSDQLRSHHKNENHNVPKRSGGFSEVRHNDSRFRSWKGFKHLSCIY